MKKKLSLVPTCSWVCYRDENRKVEHWDVRKMRKEKNITRQVLGTRFGSIL